MFPHNGVGEAVCILFPGLAGSPGGNAKGMFPHNGVEENEVSRPAGSPPLRGLRSAHRPARVGGGSLGTRLVPRELSRVGLGIRAEGESYVVFCSGRMTRLEAGASFFYRASDYIRGINNTKATTNSTMTIINKIFWSTYIPRSLSSACIKKLISLPSVLTTCEK